MAQTRSELLWPREVGLIAFWGMIGWWKKRTVSCGRRRRPGRARRAGRSRVRRTRRRRGTRRSASGWLVSGRQTGWARCRAVYGILVGWLWRGLVLAALLMVIFGVAEAWLGTLGSDAGWAAPRRGSGGTYWTAQYCCKSEGGGSRHGAGTYDLCVVGDAAGPAGRLFLSASLRAPALVRSLRCGCCTPSAVSRSSSGLPSRASGGCGCAQFREWQGFQPWRQADSQSAGQCSARWLDAGATRSVVAHCSRHLHGPARACTPSWCSDREKKELVSDSCRALRVEVAFPRRSGLAPFAAPGRPTTAPALAQETGVDGQDMRRSGGGKREKC